MCTGPRCTEAGKDAEAAFQCLGRAIDAHPGLRVKRTRSHCFAVCKEGPLMVVYPDGVWYRRVDAAAVAEIVERHLVGGKTVDALVFHRTGQGDVAPAAEGSRQANTDGSTTR
ncbi:(2Fe-2S) ferredoxin [Chitinasiproducens palmae]|uniref:(2Fe-2S) ferredoxin n=2 Tax=Chitinasiproducens palmae TaxID=1770053 RepID=A0A1H2PS05_9BURK|nr:(2Fe-2S) ferredoxin [Chitinasiproducens palmae]